MDTEKTNRSDHLISILKASISTVPIVGGSIASLISDYIPRKREERLAVFVTSLAEDLSKLERRIDDDFVHSEQFAYLFEEACRLSTQRYSAEIVDAARSVLVNSCTRVDTDQDMKEEFLRILSVLRPSHLLLLSYLNEGDLLSPRFPYRGPPGGIRNERDQPVAIIRAFCLHDVDGNLIRAMFTALVGLGLIDDPYDVEIRAVMDVKNRLTPFGKLFLEFTEVQAGG